MRIELGNWSTLAEPATLVRMSVFVHEQGVPAEMELDEVDANAVHALAWGEGGQALGTARLYPGDASGKLWCVGRMAVMAKARGRGIGSALLQSLLHRARVEGAQALSLHAQCQAQAFYAAQGFVASGPVFDEAGIAHVSMTLRL